MNSSTRLTRREVEALLAACGFVLAGEVEEAIGDDGEALQSAQAKLWQRIERMDRRKP